MLVYRDAREPIAPREAWTRLRARVARATPADLDAATSLLIDAGETASAVLDGLFEQLDRVDPTADALCSAVLAAARLFTACAHGAADPAARTAALAGALDGVDPDRLPARAFRRVSEGFAYYALDPRQYADAARRFAASERPAGAACIGLRSIGVTLAAVVAAALGDDGIPVTLWSVRPRGHPFDRRLAVDAGLEAALRAQPPGTRYLIADEGPGLSGSSFAAAARMLRACGIPAERIAFVPSWDADGSSFLSDEARATWRRHARWAAPAPSMPGEAAEARVDFSAGGWRPRLLGDESRWPAVQPQHERVKALAPGCGEIVRFAGLGRYGAATLKRACALASEGLGPDPRGLSAGYLRLAFIEGVPCASPAPPELVRQAARHVAFLARTQQAPRGAPLEALHHMIEVNAREADPKLRVPPLACWNGGLDDAPAVAVDGRMRPHEWIGTGRGWTKVDALDHADDHFLPGPQDAAWDLAGFEAEFDLPAGGTEMLLRSYGLETGDTAAAARLPFHRAAYAALQLGYATMASQSLRGASDARRFDRRAAFFLERLRALLAR
jgi:hypothetical protein